MTQDHHSHSWYFILACTNSALGFLFFSYTLGIFNSILDSIRKDVFPSHIPGLVTLIASAPFITAALSSIFSGPLSLKIGRRRLLIIADLIGIFGVILTVISNLPVMIFGRLVVGLAAGIMTVVIPLYLTEISPSYSRGQIFCAATAFSSLGTFLAFFAGLLMPLTEEKHPPTQMWKVLLGVSAIPPALNLLNFSLFFTHDTPTYYLFRGMHREAKETIKLIYRTNNVDQVLEETKQEVKYFNSQGKVRFKDLFNKKFRKAVLIGILVMCVQQIAPLQIISVYATEIFSEGISDSGLFPLILAIILAFIATVSDTSLILLSPKINQKTALVIGTLFAGFCTVLFGWTGMAISPASMISKAFLLIWPIPFGLALGSHPFVMSAETLPSKGVSVASFFNWMLAFITVQFYANFVDLIGVHKLFIILGCISISCSFIFWKFAEESEGKNKDDALKQYNENDEIKIHQIDQPLLDSQRKSYCGLDIETQ